MGDKIINGTISLTVRGYYKITGIFLEDLGILLKSPSTSFGFFYHIKFPSFKIIPVILKHPSKILKLVMLKDNKCPWVFIKISMEQY